MRLQILEMNKDKTHPMRVFISSKKNWKGKDTNNRWVEIKPGKYRYVQVKKP